VQAQCTLQKNAGKSMCILHYVFSLRETYTESEKRYADDVGDITIKERDNYMVKIY
jgi:hypothetical protein